MGLVPASLPDNLGYTCTLYTPSSPLPIFCDSLRNRAILCKAPRGAMFVRKSQKICQPTVQEVNGGQSWLSPPLPMAPKHCKTSIFGAVIVPEREFLEPHQFPERRVAGLLSFAHFEIRAACYRIEKWEIQKIPRKSAGKSAAKTRGAGVSAGEGAARGAFLGKE